MERGLARGVLTWGGRAVPEIAERSLGGSMGAEPSEHLAGARPATSIPSASGGAGPRPHILGRGACLRSQGWRVSG